MKYDEGATEQLTTQHAESDSRVSGSAGKQAGTAQKSRHIEIDARIKRARTGRPVDRLLNYLHSHHTNTPSPFLIEPSDSWQAPLKNFPVVPCRFKQFPFTPLNQI